MPQTHYPKRIIDHYINRVREHLNVSKVLLFGSFAYGKPTKHSDVDLIVVSPDFRKRGFMDRLHILSHLRDAPTYKIAMEIIGYTPEEFEEMEQHSPNLAKIKKEGKVIFPA